MTATANDPRSAFMRLEDAQRQAKECAAILAVHFEAQAREANKDDVAMFAAMGHETLARDILKQLQLMLRAAEELRDVYVKESSGGAR